MVRKARKNHRQIQVPVLVAIFLGLFFSQSALSCTVAGWNGGFTGSPLADSPTAVSRVSGFCAMQLSAPGSTKDISPNAETAANIRFYVKADGVSGTPTIFEAFSDDDATASLVSITFDGSNFVFNAGAGASGNVPGSGVTGGWNHVEMAWTGGSTMDFWVNADSSGDPTGTVNAAAGTMESVVLGAPDALIGMLTYDSYEARRMTMPGQQMICDANGDGGFSLSDILAVISERYGTPPTLAAGQPDCDLDGDVDLSDILDTIAVVFPPG